MAAICAGRCFLSHIPSNPSGLFTYGSPRVGNIRYVNHVRLPYYRWVNNNDIVTQVPPAWMGYRHTGREMYINALRQDAKHDRLAADQRIGGVDSLWASKREMWTIFVDHSIDLYIEAIHDSLIHEQAGNMDKKSKAVVVAVSSRQDPI